MENSRIAIVTGAVQGIGKAISDRLVHDGVTVIAADIDSHAGKAMMQDSEGGLLSFHTVDITDEAQVANLFTATINHYGHIDIVVNNAGILRDHLIWNMTTEDFDAVINVNLKGTWLMCREAARIMKPQAFGRIINIASRAWLGNPGQSNYSASKAGVIALTRVLALELGRYGVSVNAIAPGLIDTPLTQSLDSTVLQKLIDAQPSKSMGSPDDVANAVAFLASEGTQFITGQTLYVDGGKSIGAGIM